MGPILTGIPNTNNKCFHNAILQMLYHCDLLRQSICCANVPEVLCVQYLIHKFCNAQNVESFCLLSSELYWLFMNDTSLEANAQNDAVHLLCHILELMSSPYITFPCVSFSDLITYQMKQTVSCTSCSKTSLSDISSNILILNCFENMSIDRAVKNVNTNETVMFLCEVCGGSTAIRNVDIFNFPPVCIMILSRYHSKSSKLRGKYSINTDMFLNKKKYSLSSVVQHHGNTTTCGHYTSTIIFCGQWYFISDDVLKACEISSDNLNDSYIVVYREVDANIACDKQSDLLNASVRYSSQTTTNNVTRSIPPRAHDSTAFNSKSEVVLYIEQLISRGLEAPKFPMISRRAPWLKRQTYNVWVSKLRAKYSSNEQIKRNVSEKSRISVTTQTTPTHKRKIQSSDLLAVRTSLEEELLQNPHISFKQFGTKYSVVKKSTFYKMRKGIIEKHNKVIQREEHTAHTNTSTSKVIYCTTGVRDESSVDSDNDCGDEFGLKFKILAKTFAKDIIQTRTQLCKCCNKMLYTTQGGINKNAVVQQLLRNAGISFSLDPWICRRCSTALKSNRLPPNSRKHLATNEVPLHLSTLSVMEKRLIALILPFLKIVSLPLGQHALEGQAINFPIDLRTTILKLPRSFDQAETVFIQTPTTQFDAYKFFAISPMRICEALRWLKINNFLYRNVQIDIDLNQPCYKHVSNAGNCLIEETTVLQKDFVLPRKDAGTFISDHVGQTFKILKQKNPVNTFQVSNVEAAAFPWLFPYGKGTFDRNARLSILQYAQTRLLSVDLRWSQDLSYLFWLLNQVEQERLQDSISIAMRKHSIMSYKSMSIGSLRQNTPDDVAEDVLKNTLSFMKNIRGTSAYWNTIKSDLFALIRQLGPPTLFLTISANDLGWIDLYEVMKKVGVHLPGPASELTSSQRAKLLSANPVIAAHHFHHRWKCLKTFIFGPNGPFGKLSDFFWRIEFQMRGSPHVHCLLWLQNSPDLNTTLGKQECPEFIDSIISASIPNKEKDPDLYEKVTSKQIHHHTFSCKSSRNKRTKCRFNFPKPIAKKTVLTHPDDVGHKPNFYNLKRNKHETMVNNYNPSVLKLFNANMDLQVVGSVIGMVDYITTYVCKPETSDLHRKLADKIANLPPNSGKIQKLRAIGNVLLTSRHVSSQEAAYRLTSLPFKEVSRKVVYIDTSRPDDRLHLLRSQQELQELSDDSTDIFVSSLVEHYIQRPDMLENISLYDFVTQYDYRKADASSKMLPLKKSGYIKKRSKSAVVKLPYKTPENNGDEYFYQLILMYKPFRDENSLLDPHKTAFEAINAFSSQLNVPSNHINFTRELERSLRRVAQLDIVETVAPSTYEASERVVQSEISSCFYDQDEDTLPVLTNLSSQDDDQNIVKPPCADIELQISRMNTEQKRIFTLIREHCNDMLKWHLKILKDRPKQLHMFVSGPGGTGKSFLISCIHSYIQGLFGSACILCAPTGIAAFNINGLTLHRALRLDVEHRKTADYKKLSDQTLRDMREAWKNIQYLIIDEISMVSYEMFLIIHQRLNEIFAAESSVFFGNLNVLCFGDFFQLRPVMGHFVFHDDTNTLPFHLWKDLFQCQHLTINMRQRDHKDYSLLCNRFRVGLQTSDDINLLTTRMQPHVKLNDPAFKNAIYIFPTIAQCLHYNNSCLKKLSNVTCIPAIHALIGGMNLPPGVIASTIPAGIIPKDDRQCAGLANMLPVAVGAKVMLTRNIDTGEGLVNGAIGIIREIFLPLTSSIPTVIYVQFNDSSIGSSYKDQRINAVKITPVTARFFGNRGTLLTRTQFPIQLCFAATIHKLQGCTLDKAVLYLGKKLFAAGMAYVALSRVRSLEDIMITDLHPLSVGFRASTLAAAEMNRLNDIECSVK